MSVDHSSHVSLSDQFKQQYMQHWNSIHGKYVNVLTAMKNPTQQRIIKSGSLNNNLKQKYLRRLNILHEHVKATLNSEFVQYRQKAETAINTMSDFHVGRFEKDIKSFCAPLLDNAHVTIRSLIKYHDKSIYTLLSKFSKAEEIEEEDEPTYFVPYILPLQMDAVHKRIKNHDDKIVHRSSLQFIVENAKHKLKVHIDNQLARLNKDELLDIRISYSIKYEMERTAESIFSSLDLSHQAGTPSVDEILLVELLILRYTNAVNELTVNKIKEFFNPKKELYENVRQLQMDALRYAIRHMVLQTDTFDNVLTKAMEKKISVSQKKFKNLSKFLNGESLVLFKIFL